MPSSHENWETTQLPVLQEVLGYDIIIPTWWMGSGTGTPNPHAVRVMVEEITHFMTQFGWSKAYPAEFGVDSWDSIIARETQRARCDWWQHPENDCPNSPAEAPGDCSDPSCDAVEFYHQVLITRAGMTPAWLGIGFPDNKSELEDKLSIEMKEMMSNPKFHQITHPLTLTY